MADQINGDIRSGTRYQNTKTVADAYPKTFAKYRMWSFTMVMGPHQTDLRMHEMEIVSDYLLYYHNTQGTIGVVQFSKGTTYRQLEELYAEFVFQKLTSEEMLTRIGWIHRNKTAHTEIGTFRRRCVVKPLHEDNKREYLYFYNPETGIVAKMDKQTGIAEPARTTENGPYQMRQWDSELRQFVNRSNLVSNVNDEPK